MNFIYNNYSLVFFWKIGHHTIVVKSLLMLLRAVHYPHTLHWPDHVVDYALPQHRRDPNEPDRCVNITSGTHPNRYYDAPSSERL